MHVHTPLPPAFGALLALIANAPATTAQNAFNPNIGAALSAGDDTLHTVPLGFTFAFPGGATASSIDIDSNGRILRPGTDPSDATQTVTELLADPASICPLWVDMDFLSATTDDVHFNALPNVALITWRSTEDWWQTVVYSFQCQLYSNGRIVFVYDGRIPGNFTLQPNPVVGVSRGNAAPDPGNSNFSTAPFSRPGVATIYEDFLGPFDLQDSWLEFVPNAGGYDVNKGSPSGFPPTASATRYGSSCPVSIEITPNGLGGYVLTPCGNCWDPVLGTGLGVTMTDEMIVGKALGFTFPFPGGTTATSIDIDTKVRVLPGNTSDAPDFSATVAELRNDPWPTIAPFWSDLDQQLNGGDIFFRSAVDGQGRNVATITWSGIAQWGTGPSSSIDVQCKLRNNGSMVFSFRGSASFDMTNGTDVLIGFSRGNGAADPGESNLSALGTPGSPTSITSGAVLYEFFDSFVPERLDLQLTTESLTPPVVMGSPWSLRIDGVPTGSIAAAILLGVSNPQTPLAAIGMQDCFLLTDVSITSIPMTILGGSTNTLNIPIGTTSLAGANLFLQGGVLAPGQGITALGAVLAQGVRCRIGL